MNERELKLFDDYAKKFHSKHQEEKQKRDLEFWIKRIEKCKTYEELLSLEMTTVNAVEWNTYIKLKKYINENIKERINNEYIKKPLTLTQKIKNLFK